MMKIVIMIMTALVIEANAYMYDVKFKGMTLGEVSDLSTLKHHYLKAAVTNPIARFMLGKSYLVYYADVKPSVADSKYKKDNKMILYAFATSLKERPKFKKFKINDSKNITLSCEGGSCRFTYYKNDHIDGKGEILFDGEGRFLSITEEMSDFMIVRK